MESPKLADRANENRPIDEVVVHQIPLNDGVNGVQVDFKSSQFGFNWFGREVSSAVVGKEPNDSLWAMVQKPKHGLLDQRNDCGIHGVLLSCQHYHWIGDIIKGGELLSGLASILVILNQIRVLLFVVNNLWQLFLTSNFNINSVPNVAPVFVLNTGVNWVTLNEHAPG